MPRRSERITTFESSRLPKTRFAVDVARMDPNLAKVGYGLVTGGGGACRFGFVENMAALLAKLEMLWDPGR